MQNLRPYSRPSGCQNLNHRRANAMVAHCPECGDPVNPALARGDCDEARHGEVRRRRVAHCPDCGQRLIGARA